MNLFKLFIYTFKLGVRLYLNPISTLSGYRSEAKLFMMGRKLFSTSISNM